MRIYDSSVDFNLSYLSCFFCIFQIHLLLYRWHFIYYSCICRKSWVVCLISRCSISSITWWIYSTPRTAAWFYIRISSTIASDICFPLTCFQFFIFFLLVWTSLSRSFWRLTQSWIHLIRRLLNMLYLLFSWLIQIFRLSNKLLKFLL